mmetsp:Transcript_4379/g.9403  ORF Transcript_4379/g.9403 Transcript_4379/m.9403 type:complete len:264 (-) Transcript_4379:514-1305(-)
MKRLSPGSPWVKISSPLKKIQRVISCSKRFVIALEELTHSNICSSLGACFHSIRKAATCLICCRSSGNLPSTSNNFSLGNSCMKHVSEAVTVAVAEGAKPMATSSPQMSPLFSSETFFPSQATVAAPWWMRNKELCCVPSWQMTCPAVKSLSCMSSAMAAANSALQSWKKLHKWRTRPPFRRSRDTRFRVAANSSNLASSCGNSLIASSKDRRESTRTSESVMAMMVADRFLTSPSTAISPKNIPPSKVPTLMPLTCTSMVPE